MKHVPQIGGSVGVGDGGEEVMKIGRCGDGQ